MIYSNACSYAIRAMTRLAMVRPDGYVLLDELCDGTDLPRHFLAKIFQDLVRHRLLISAKGRGGGFALARSPDSITLFDIAAAVDGAEQFDQCVVGMSKCDDAQPCPLHDEFQPIPSRIQKFITTTTLKRMSQTLDRKMQLIGNRVRMPASKSKSVRGRS